jgi:hypothetical protein
MIDTFIINFVVRAQDNIIIMMGIVKFVAGQVYPVSLMVPRAYQVYTLYLFYCIVEVCVILFRSRYHNNNIKHFNPRRKVEVEGLLQSFGNFCPSI